MTANYDLPGSIACRLLRSYTNDVYLVESPSVRYALKVYGQNWRSPTEVLYETALLQHLKARGAMIAGPIAARDGTLVQSIVVAQGDQRPAVLFAWTPGAKPEPPFSLKLYEAFGEAIAQMHALSADFATGHTRRTIDLTYLIEEPLLLLLPLLEDNTDRLFLRELADQIRNRMAGFVAAGLEWGPIHGDATLDNLHVTEDGTVLLFDFDSGGPGWRASDLQGWTILSEEYAERGVAFRTGYSCVRALPPVDIAAAPTLLLAWDIWGMKVDLENRILKQGPEQTRMFLQEQVHNIRERAHVIVAHT